VRAMAVEVVQGDESKEKGGQHHDDDSGFCWTRQGHCILVSAVS
jgi:hypothetical protein